MLRDTGRKPARRGLVVGACLLTFLGTACTPSDPAPPTLSPSPSASTPTETAQEREQRLAYEAAEKSYREFRIEYNQVLERGGASKPTTGMEKYAGGPYLEELQAGSAAYEGLRHHSRGHESIEYVRPDGYNSKELVMQICEDGRSVVTLDAKGKKLYSGDLRELHLVFKLKNGIWKAWTGSGKKVSTCS